MIVETLPDAVAGERIDRVVTMLCDCSRSQAANLIGAGQVCIDGAVVTARSQRVEAGSEISIDPTELAESIEVVADHDVSIDVVYEDEHLVVINKPAGLVVHPGAGNPIATMVHGVLARYPEIAEVGQPERPGIVHRLDRGTSGLLVVARTAEAYDELVLALSMHEVTRQYLAVAWGVFRNDQGTVDAAIGRSSRRRTRMTVTDAGKPARTHYTVLQRRLEDPRLSLVECELETGRTHQIRVHLQAIGHAIVGDDQYGGSRGSVVFASPVESRPALHARRLGFVHPVTGESIDCTAPVPADMAELIGTWFDEGV